jgi:hypothetical protein
MYPENISGARRWSNVCIHVSYVHAFSLSDTVCEACVRVGRHRGRGPCGWRPAGRSVPSHTRDGGPATVRQLAGTNAHGGTWMYYLSICNHLYLDQSTSTATLHGHGHGREDGRFLQIDLQISLFYDCMCMSPLHMQHHWPANSRTCVRVTSPR